MNNKFVCNVVSPALLCLELQRMTEFETRDDVEGFEMSGSSLLSAQPSTHSRNCQQGRQSFSTY